MKYLLVTVILLFVAQTNSFGQSESFRLLLDEARRGNVNSQNEVGIAYLQGIGIRENEKKALYWFRKSAENGYAIAACNVGLHYGSGWGVRKDKTLMMKYIFAAHALDGLKCHPSNYIEAAKPTECQIKIGWEAAVIWLRAHPSFKNSFDEQPWMKPDGEYPITFREGSSPSSLPVKSKKKCK